MRRSIFTSNYFSTEISSSILNLDNYICAKYYINNKLTSYIYYEKTKKIGYIEFNSINDFNLYVYPEYRHKTLGKQLLIKATEVMKQECKIDKKKDKIDKTMDLRNRYGLVPLENGFNYKNLSVC
jgi:hypothetical protein